MTEIHGKNKKFANIAAVTVVGALGAAAYYAFSDERRRKKITDTLTSARDGVVGRFSDMHEPARKETFETRSTTSKYPINKFTKHTKRKAR